MSGAEKALETVDVELGDRGRLLWFVLARSRVSRLIREVLTAEQVGEPVEEVREDDLGASPAEEVETDLFGAHPRVRDRAELRNQFEDMADRDAPVPDVVDIDAVELLQVCAER